MSVSRRHAHNFDIPKSLIHGNYTPDCVNRLQYEPRIDSCGDDASRIPPEMSSAAVYMYTCSTGIKKAPVRPRLHACTYARLMHVTTIENHRSARGKKKRTKRPSYIEFRKNSWTQFPGAGISRGMGVGALEPTHWVGERRV